MNTSKKRSRGTPAAHAPALVSIIIPCYRGEQYLAEAIKSCLRQTYRAVEIVVVDDASPDSCAELAESFARLDSRVRLVRRKENGGVARAFNSGLATARGDFFSRLAQDDVLEPGCIESLVRHLSSRPDDGLAYCDYYVCDQTGARLRTVVTPPAEEALRTRNQIGLCVMWPRGVWNAIGGFDPDFDAAEDFEYWLRIAHRFRIGKCESPPAMKVRVHDAMGSLRRQVLQNYNSRKAIAKWSSRHGKHGLSRRVALAYADYSASITQSELGNQGEALSLLLRSVMNWPIALPREAESIPAARAKLFAIALCRFLRLRSSPRRGEQVA